MMKFPQKSQQFVTSFPFTPLPLLSLFLFFVLKKKRKRCTWALKIPKIPKIWPNSQMEISEVPKRATNENLGRETNIFVSI